MATTTLPTTAGNMEGGAICTVVDLVIQNTRHAALPFLTQKGISTTEVEGGAEPMPPAPPVWQGQQSMGLPTAAHPQGPHGQYGLPAAPGPLGGGALAHPTAPMLLAPGTQQGEAPRAPGNQQGGAPLAPPRQRRLGSQTSYHAPRVTGGIPGY